MKRVSILKQSEIQIFSNGEIKEELAALPRYFERYDTMGGINNRHLPKFEEKFSRITKRTATSINGCTNGIYLALKRLNLNGDPVLVPPVTFFGVGSSIVKAGGIPVYTRTTPEGLMDVESCLEVVDKKFFGKKPKAVIPCHINSRFNDPRKLNGVIEIVEDAASAFGTTTPEGECIVASTPNISIISFSYGKPLTAGEGGMIFSDEEVSRWIKGHRYCGLENMDGMYGYGVFNVTDPDLKFPYQAVSAMLIMEKLKRFDQQLKRRREIATYYQERFGYLNEIQLYENGNQLTFMIMNTQRDRIQNYLTEKGIKSYLNHRPMYKLDAFAHYPGVASFVETTEHYFNRVLHIPCRHDLSDSDVEYIADSMRDIYEKI